MSERRSDEGEATTQPVEHPHERARRAWRDIHEALYYAATVTGCVQYADFGGRQARRGDIGGDLDALRCLEQGGHLPGEVARGYALLHTDFTAMMRPGGAGSGIPVGVEAFTAAVHDLEARLWALVPIERLPIGMFAAVASGRPGRLHLARRSRRTGNLLL